MAPHARLGQSTINRYRASKRYRRKGKFLTQDDIEATLRSLGTRLEREELRALMLAIDEEHNERDEGDDDEHLLFISFDAFVKFGSMIRKSAVISSQRMHRAAVAGARQDKLLTRVEQALIVELLDLATKNRDVRGRPNFRIPFSLFHDNGREAEPNVPVSEFIDKLSSLRVASDLNLSQLRRLIRRIDANSDGVVTIEEFIFLKRRR